MYGYRINLNKYSKELDELRRKNRAFVLLSIAVVLVFSGIYYYYYLQYSMLNDQISQREDRLENVVNKTNSLKQSERFISEQEIDKLNNIYNNKITWTKKIEALRGIESKDFKLKSVHFDKGKLTLKILARVQKGVAEFDRANEFIERLESNMEFMAGLNENYKDKFQFFVKEKIGDEKMITFALEYELLNKGVTLR